MQTYVFAAGCFFVVAVFCFDFALESKETFGAGTVFKVFIVRLAEMLGQLFQKVQVSQILDSLATRASVLAL